MLWYLSCSIKPVEGETYEDTKVAGLRWYRFLLQQGLDVVAPHWGLLQALDDKSPEERKLGMYIADLVHERCDGLVTVGGKERILQSSDCMHDIKLARSRQALHLDFTDMTEDEVATFLTRLPAPLTRVEELERDLESMAPYPPAKDCMCDDPECRHRQVEEHSYTPAASGGCVCGDPECGTARDWE